MTIALLMHSSTMNNNNTNIYLECIGYLEWPKTATGMQRYISFSVVSKMKLECSVLVVVLLLHKPVRCEEVVRRKGVPETQVALISPSLIGPPRKVVVVHDVVSRRNALLRHSKPFQVALVLRFLVIVAARFFQLLPNEPRSIVVFQAMSVEMLIDVLFDFTLIMTSMLRPRTKVSICTSAGTALTAKPPCVMMG